ncbi:MAG: hypothetical protein ABIJ21_06760 [Nanoarchaeota archaeon]
MKYLLLLLLCLLVIACEVQEDASGPLVIDLDAPVQNETVQVNETVENQTSPLVPSVPPPLPPSPPGIPGDDGPDVPGEPEEVWTVDATLSGDLSDLPEPFLVNGMRDYSLVWSSGSVGVGCQINLEGEFSTLQAQHVSQEDLVDQWPDLRAGNLIVIGNACINKFTAAILGNPEPCDQFLRTGRGYVKLYELAEGSRVLLIMGKTGSDTLNACKKIGEGLAMEGNDVVFVI